MSRSWTAGVRRARVRFASLAQAGPGPAVGIIGEHAWKKAQAKDAWQLGWKPAGLCRTAALLRGGFAIAGAKRAGGRLLQWTFDITKATRPEPHHGVVRILAPFWPRFARGRGNSLLELSLLQHQTSNQVGQFGLTVMPLEGNADMIVWRQAVDTELRLAAQWEESWGFLKEQSAKDEAKRQKVVLPKLSDTKGYGSVSGAPAVSKDNVHDLPVSTPRLFLATSQQAYKQRPPIEELHMKRWTVRRDPELWPTICPAK
ncbi:unnamed protein product [Symbiodinium microadriaticum]|nr:unnamed protein product [Symbiodinium microadriaticum]